MSTLHQSVTKWLLSTSRYFPNSQLQQRLSFCAHFWPARVPFCMPKCNQHMFKITWSKCFNYCKIFKSLTLMFKFCFKSKYQFRKIPQFQNNKQICQISLAYLVAALHQPTHIKKLKNINKGWQNIIISYTCPKTGFRK